MTEGVVCPLTPAVAAAALPGVVTEMRAGAADLRYEEAALLRDEIAEIRSSIPG